jgi:hypothetical protein
MDIKKGRAQIMASHLQCFATALRFLSRFFLAVSFVIGFSSYSAAATQVTFAWDANSEPDLAGYHLYMRQAGQGYDYSVRAYTGSDPSCTIEILDDSAEHCFVVRAYDVDGNESPDSNEVCKAAASVDPGDIDRDGDGYTTAQGDCDDNDPDRKPGESEVCDGKDNDCDGQVDEGLTFDSDNDGYTSTSSCLGSKNDCNDNNSLINPGAGEVCDGKDNDCDGQVDEGLTFDSDNDGYTSTNSCLGSKNDCNDDNGAVNPEAEDVCGDGIDQNCDGSDKVCQVPDADAGPDQRTVVGGEVLLNGSNSTSASGGALSYSWRQTAGDQVQLTDTQSSTLTFQAPEVEQALEFELTVTDMDENMSTSTDACIVNVCGQNEPPTADAGPTIEVSSGQSVVLDGTGSLGDGGTLTYSWLKTEGPEIMLTDKGSAKPVFISPAVGPEGASLTFQLTVTDQSGLKDTDSCIVNVTSINYPPEAAVTNDYIEAPPLTVVTLDGTLSTDQDDGIDAYRWHQLEGAPVTFDDPKSSQVKFSAPASGPYGSNLLFALSVKDKSGLKKSAKSVVFVPSEITEAAQFRVLEPITMTLFQKGPFYQAKVSVFVVDDAGIAVKDVAVEGKWSLPLPDGGEYAVTAYTSGAGEAKIDSERFKVKDPGEVSFTVTALDGRKPLPDGTTKSTLPVQ